MIDINAQRHEFIAKRNLHGADTPIGHRCSNAVEQIESRRRLDVLFAQSLDEIATLELAEIL